ncbi:helix-turn-helix domain-containing protein [bacterium]|nr:helix-turn-helix domain-containing protein [bacterium]
MSTRNLTNNLIDRTSNILKEYSLTTGIHSIIVDADVNVMETFGKSWVCGYYYSKNSEECKKDHDLVIKEANRLGNTFIHLCHKNFVIWGLPLTIKGKIVGGAISGFVLFEQNEQRLPEYRQDFPLISPEKTLISSKLVSKYSKALFELFKSGQLFDIDLFRISEEKAYIQREIGEKLIEKKTKGELERNIIHEKQDNLMNSIKFCEMEEIRDNLNDVLSEIFLEGISNINLLKFRMLELFVLISRTMLEVGGNIDEFYHLTSQYIINTEKLDDIYSFSLWLKEILNDFILSVIKTRKKLGQVNRAVEYIKKNLIKKLTISEVASFVAMSESRFSFVFRQEMGTSFPEYVNSLKVEKAKDMISNRNIPFTEIATGLSFYDQSYFTKTFKKFVGLTPKQYLKKLTETPDNQSTKETIGQPREKEKKRPVF